MENVKSLILSELFKTNFSIFADLDADKRKSQIEKIHYIDTISRQLETDISMSNLLEFIPNENGIITATNAEINKALIGFTPEKIKTITEVFEITSEVKKSLLALNNKTVVEEKSRLRDVISNCSSKMEDYQKKYMHHSTEKAKTIR